MTPAPARPRVFYGWVMAWMLGPTQLVSWGVLYYAFSVVMPRMRAEMGWSTAEITGAFSAAMLASGIAAVPDGQWLVRHGPRWMMTAGSVAAALLVVAWSQVTSLAALYAVWTCIGVIMAMVLYDPAFWVIARWFKRGRDRALTLVTFWGGLASTAFIPLTDMLAGAFGWRAGLGVIAGILALCTILPHALLLRRRPEDVGQIVDGESGPRAPDAHAGVRTRDVEGVVGDRAFALLAIAFGLTSLLSSAMSVHLISYEISRGVSASVAAAAAGAVGALQVAGRLTFAPLAGRVSRKRVTALMCAFTAIAILALIGMTPLVGLAVYVVLYGMGHGALTPLRASLVAEYFGTSAYGRVNGALSLVVTLARAAAPIAVGALVTLTDTYIPVLLTLSAGALIAAGAVLFLREERVPARAPG